MSTPKIYDQWTKFLLEYKEYFKSNVNESDSDKTQIDITSKSKITSNYKK